MRQLAMVVAAFLVCAMISPAFAQPFADTPTNHWAYDAIAELAAKGLIEGYPDGTFKGDRAMTRYEMAMVVARLLARIESIQIPAPQPPPKPEVTKADIDMILRLVNEFRAELAAKNVRLTAVEEELNAIKAKLDNVRITGRFRFRYDSTNEAASGTPLPNIQQGTVLPSNANTGQTPAQNQNVVFRAREGLKVQMDGSVTPDVHAIIGIELASTASSTPLTFNSGGFGISGIGTGAGAGSNSPQYIFANIVDLFFDWKNMWGTPLELWIGRFGYGQQGFGGYPVQFGPFGLLLNTNSDTYGASTSDATQTATHMIDGLRLSAHIASLADLQIQGLVWRVAGSSGGGSYNFGEDAYGIDANAAVFPGFRIGVYYVGNTIPNGGTSTPGAPNPQYHVYGNPGTPSTNPPTALTTATPGCLASPTGVATFPSGAPTQGGITCPALGNGWGAYIGWDAIPGVHLDVEAAQWNDQVHGTNDQAAYANVSWDLGTMLGWGHALTLGTGYQYEGPNFYAPYQNDPDDIITGSLFPGNLQGFRATIDFDLIPSVLSLHGGYLTGNTVSNSQPAQEWQGIISYKFAPGASVFFRYDNQTQQGITQSVLYRLEMNYTF